MGRLFAFRATVCRAERLFEELEERIVLDASIDQDVHNHGLNGPDASATWGLEYSSDPAATVEHVLNTSDLAAYPGDLSLSPPPNFNFSAMGPIMPVAPGGVADLSGAVRIVGDTAVDMIVTIDYNPLKLSENAITGVSFTAIANLPSLEITPPTTTGVTQTSWIIQGPVEAVNAVLSTMQATISQKATNTSMGHIMVSVTDTDYSTTDPATRGNSQFAVKNFYIPIQSSGNTASEDCPVLYLTGPLHLAGVDAGATVFPGTDILIGDSTGRVVDVGLRVLQGTLIPPASSVYGVQVISAPPANGVVSPPGATEGSDWMPGWLYIRGGLEGINAYLHNVTYQRFQGDPGGAIPVPAHGTLGDTTVDDTLIIAADDRGTNGMSPWWGDPVTRSTRQTVNLIYDS